MEGGQVVKVRVTQSEGEEITCPFVVSGWWGDISNVKASFDKIYVFIRYPYSEYYTQILGVNMPKFIHKMTDDWNTVLEYRDHKNRKLTGLYEINELTEITNNY